MKKQYEKKPVLFAVLFIVLYCAVTIPIRGEYGDGSIQSLLGLSAVAAAIAVVSSLIPLWKRLGVAAKPQNVRLCLCFLPMILLATGNVWDGFVMHYNGAALWYAIGSMALVGFVEEMLFRGFLFRALLKKDGPRVAVIVSAVTFGIGHIVNLLAGIATVENLMMIVFAVAWGFVFTMVYYKSGSLPVALYPQRHAARQWQFFYLCFSRIFSPSSISSPRTSWIFSNFFFECRVSRTCSNSSLPYF